MPLLAAQVLPDRLDLARVATDDIAGVGLVEHVADRAALAQPAVLHRMPVDALVGVEGDQRDAVGRVEDPLGRSLAPRLAQVVRDDLGS